MSQEPKPVEPPVEPNDKPHEEDPVLYPTGPAPTIDPFDPAEAA